MRAINLILFDSCRNLFFIWEIHSLFVLKTLDKESEKKKNSNLQKNNNINVYCYRIQIIISPKKKLCCFFRFSVRWKRTERQTRQASEYSCIKLWIAISHDYIFLLSKHSKPCVQRFLHTSVLAVNIFSFFVGIEFFFLLLHLSIFQKKNNNNSHNL